jgi:hypothetical protein
MYSLQCVWTRCVGLQHACDSCTTGPSRLCRAGDFVLRYSHSPV